MQQRRFAPGDVVFREGDPSDNVFRVIEGSVEVVKEGGPNEVVLGHIGPGEFVGEMGVMIGRPRSATIRAQDDLIVESIEKDAFVQQVSEHSETARELIVRLSERLRAVDEAYAEAVFSAAPRLSEGAPAHAETIQPEVAQVKLFAESAVTSEHVPVEGLTITTFPFVVGRLPNKGEPSPRVALDLVLEDTPPYRLSRGHFAFVRDGDRLELYDVGSQLGTAVNGEFLGLHFGKDAAHLREGDNDIVAGGLDSPFRFRAVYRSGGD